jgi:hypothetical protein
MLLTMAELAKLKNQSQANIKQLMMIKKELGGVIG